VNLGQPVFIKAKDDGGGGDNWTTGAISRAKLQSNHHQQTTTHFLQASCPSCRPTTVSKHWRESLFTSNKFVTSAALVEVCALLSVVLVGFLFNLFRNYSRLGLVPQEEPWSISAAVILQAGCSG